MDCIANLAYNPVEHAVWARQTSLLKNNITLSVWCTKLWLILLVINIIRTVQSMSKHSKRKGSLQWKLSHLLDLIQNCTDLINAINFLPRGFLWSSRLSSVIVGVMGIISSTIGLYKLL